MDCDRHCSQRQHFPSGSLVASILRLVPHQLCPVFYSRMAVDSRTATLRTGGSIAQIRGMKSSCNFTLISVKQKGLDLLHTCWERVSSAHDVVQMMLHMTNIIVHHKAERHL